MRNIDFITTGTTDNLKFAVDMTFAKYPQTLSWVIGNGPQEFLVSAYLGNPKEAIEEFQKRVKRSRAVRQSRIRETLDFGNPSPQLVSMRIKFLEKRASQWLSRCGIKVTVKMSDGGEADPGEAIIKHTKRRVQIQAKGIGAAMPELALVKAGAVGMLPLHICTRRGNRFLIWGISVIDGQVRGSQSWHILGRGQKRIGR
jgi:hypothetical protein